MKEILLITSIFDSLSGKSSSDKSTESEYTIEDYQELLIDYKNAEADILINIAIIHFEDENIPQSIKNLVLAGKIYEELGNIEKQALVQDLIGDINRHNKKIDSARENYNEAYRLYYSIKSELKNNVREKIEKLDTMKKAEDAINIYSHNSPKESTATKINTPEYSNDTSDYIKISKNIEKVFGMLRGAEAYRSYIKSEDPMGELKNAYEMSSGIGDNAGMATLLLIMGDVSLKEGKTEDALKYLNNSLEEFQQIDDMIGEAVSRLLIGTAYYITGYMEKVPQNFRKSIEILRNLNDINGENIAMNLINAIYED